MTDRFYAIPDHEDYFITRTGRVFFNGENPRWLNVFDWNGYDAVSIKGKGWKTHLLLAKVFIKNPKELNCVHHKDGDRYNNVPENLEWMDSVEHIRFHKSLKKGAHNEDIVNSL